MMARLSPAARRAFVLADNKLVLNAGWDCEILAIEMQALVDLDIDVDLTGFSLAEVDLLIDEAGEASLNGADTAEDAIPASFGPPVCRQGDLRKLGRHRLLCGDTRSDLDLDRLMAGTVQIVCLDGV